MRLAFSVAAHLESEILIVDEVLAVGDAGFQKKCLNKMLEISGRGRTLLFVSHDMNAISTLCTKALELSHGRVVETPRLPDPEAGDPANTPAESAGLRSVTQAISDYVLDGGACAERIWADADAPRMRHLRVALRRVAVVNAAGQACDSFDVSEDVRIVVEFDAQAGDVDLNVHLYVTTLTGHRLLVAMDNQDIPGALRPRPAGRYAETCLIKKDFLNEGTFRIEVVICTHPTTENYIAVPDAASFAITDDLKSPAVRGDWAREWPDYPIRTRLPWQVNHHEETQR
jgi:lipopolysaccharide transport system ATP-binding protein